MNLDMKLPCMTSSKRNEMTPPPTSTTKWNNYSKKADFLFYIHRDLWNIYLNGSVERFNRILMDAVRCFVQSSQGSWDLYLAQIAGTLRSCMNSDRGFTPNKLMLGMSAKLWILYIHWSRKICGMAEHRISTLQNWRGQWLKQARLPGINEKAPTRARVKSMI